MGSWKTHSLGRIAGALALCLLALTALSSCVFLRKPKTPMTQVEFPSSGEARHLLVMLPGLADRPEAFQKGGFIDEAQSLGQFDVVVADAHFGYYRTFGVRERLMEDVIAPIRGDYEELWLVGVSMGGYGAIAFAEKYPGEVTGIVLLAPYLGQNKVVRDIEAAGSLSAWDPDAFDDKGSERTAHSVTIWRWLQAHGQQTEEPIVLLGSGEDDRHMREMRLLEPVLPSERVRVVPGGHDWGPWRQLFAWASAEHLSQR